ncbi:abhydrolase domain-containing 12 [Collybia nuda]|uniref:Abhydrolase domain-containing 12 n=1 Tax=Collybia nuda TaxID=64659 RepID=A0A9P5XXQ6_9AGAR|nr:abhydrolase domain-containing 12 [Collybia nuda]
MSLMFRFLESQILFMNAIKLPLFADFTHPEKYGLLEKQTLNLTIRTPDNETLGAWFILSRAYHDTLSSTSGSVETHIRPALTKHRTILFLHGNSATRAFQPRVQYYQTFTRHLGTNVLAVDYRGFADSTGTPSETGLVCDARSAWDWLLGEGARPEDILVVGHSLGTGVASQLGAQLSKEGIGCCGVVLLSPFSSVPEALSTYNIFGAIPLMKPLSLIPPLPSMITQALIHKFDTLSTISDIKYPILIAHATDDWVIPHTHSDVLFTALLEPALPHHPPPRNALHLTLEEVAAEEDRRARREELVTHTDLPGVGGVDVGEREGRRVVLVKTDKGGHDYIGVQEGVWEAIGTSFGFF